MLLPVGVDECETWFTNRLHIGTGLLFLEIECVFCTRSLHIQPSELLRAGEIVWTSQANVGDGETERCNEEKAIEKD